MRNKKIIVAALLIIITMILAIALDVTIFFNLHELLRNLLTVVIFIGLIITAIISRNYIGFLGFLFGTLIKIVICKQYFPDTQINANIFTLLVYGLYFLITGMLYKKYLDKKMNIKNIIVFCTFVFLTDFLFWPIRDLVTFPKLIKIIFVADYWIYLLLFSLVLGFCILGILLFKYLICSNRGKLPASAREL